VHPPDLAVIGLPVVLFKDLQIIVDPDAVEVGHGANLQIAKVEFGDVFEVKILLQAMDQRIFEGGHYVVLDINDLVGQMGVFYLLFVKVTDPFLPILLGQDARVEKGVEDVLGHARIVEFWLPDQGIPNQVAENNVFVRGGNEFQLVFVPEPF